MTDTADRNPPVLPPGRELDALAAEANLIAWAIRAEDHRLSDRALRLADSLRALAVTSALQGAEASRE